MTAAIIPFKTLLKGHKRVRTVNTEQSRTHQSFQAECDINCILAKWQKTGVIEHANGSQPQFGDYVHVDDYHTSINRVLSAQTAFMSLPSAVRLKFENDPAKFLEFAQDEKNRDEMIDLGLCKPDTVKSSDLNEKKSPATPVEKNAGGIGDA